MCRATKNLRPTRVITLMRQLPSLDEALPSPEAEPELSPSQLLADFTAADAHERASLGRELVEAGFEKVAIAEQGFGKWKFELVHRGGEHDGSEAFGRLDALLAQFSLVLQEATFEMEISRNLTTASFLCLRDLPQSN